MTLLHYVVSFPYSLTLPEARHHPLETEVYRCDGIAWVKTMQIYIFFQENKQKHYKILTTPKITLQIAFLDAFSSSI